MYSTSTPKRALKAADTCVRTSGVGGPEKTTTPSRRAASTSAFHSRSQAGGALPGLAAPEGACGAAGAGAAGAVAWQPPRSAAPPPSARAPRNRRRGRRGVEARRGGVLLMLVSLVPSVAAPA